MADGSIRLIPSETPEDKLRAMIPIGSDDNKKRK
jgi:hypothetical protein